MDTMNKRGAEMFKMVMIILGILMFLGLMIFVFKSRVFGSEAVGRLGDYASQTYGGADRFIAVSSNVNGYNFMLNWDKQNGVDDYTIVVKPRNGDFPSDMSKSPLSKYVGIECANPSCSASVTGADFGIKRAGTYDYEVRGLKGDKVVALAKSYVVLNGN